MTDQPDHAADLAAVDVVLPQSIPNTWPDSLLNGSEMGAHPRLRGLGRGLRVFYM